MDIFLQLLGVVSSARQIPSMCLQVLGHICRKGNSWGLHLHGPIVFANNYLMIVWGFAVHFRGRLYLAFLGFS